MQDILVEAEKKLIDSADIESYLVDGIIVLRYIW